MRVEISLTGFTLVAESRIDEELLERFRVDPPKISFYRTSGGRFPLNDRTDADGAPKEDIGSLSSAVFYGDDSYVDYRVN